MSGEIIMTQRARGLILFSLLAAHLWFLSDEVMRLARGVRYEISPEHVMLSVAPVWRKAAEILSLLLQIAAFSATGLSLRGASPIAWLAVAFYTPLALYDNRMWGTILAGGMLCCLVALVMLALLALTSQRPLQTS
jgi:hypothetical protein